LGAFVFGGAHEPFDAHCESGRHALRSVDQVAFEIAVGKPHLVFVGLSGPKARARGLIDDRLRDLEVGGKLADFALQQPPQRQQICAAIAVLREVADGQLTAVAGATCGAAA
jgi:hypothetical protein